MINKDAFGSNMARAAAVVDFYAVLGISENASADEIHKAYRKKALDFHPDRNPNSPVAQEQFVLVSTAYKVLINPERKKQYDYFRKNEPAKATPETPNQDTKKQPESWTMDDFRDFCRYAESEMQKARQELERLRNKIFQYAVFPIGQHQR